MIGDAEAVNWFVREENCTERDLWRAVLIQMFRDCEYLGTRFYEFSETGKITSYCDNTYSIYLRSEQDLKNQISTMEHQLRHEWVQEICDIAKINYSNFYHRCRQTLRGLN